MKHSLVRLGDICTVVSGSTPKSGISDYWDGDVVWITPAELTEDSYIINDSVRHITQKAVQETSLKPFPAGTVILSSRAPIGKTAIAGREMYCNQGFKNLICSSRVNNKYLYFFLSCKTEYLNSLGRGATFKEISKTIVENIEIPLPGIPEQKRIATEFEHIQGLEQGFQKQVSFFDQLVKSQFVEMFGDPLHPVHSRALGDVAVLERGRFSPRPRNDPRYYGGDYPFIQTGDIAGCGHRLSEYRQTLNEKGIHVSKKFSAGTIVIAIVGATIGATAILEIDVYAPDSVIGISVNDELYNNVFMEALLQFWQPELVRIAPESARANINLGILQSIPIIDVELPRQIQFAAFVAQVDKSKVEIQKAIDQLEILKKSLMQQYFG